MHTCVVSMAGFHHPGDPYFPDQGNNGWLEEPDEYTDTNYEFEGADEDMEEDRNVNEAPEEPPADEAQQDHPAPPVDPVDEDCSLEAEVATLRQQLFVMETRAVQAEQERDEVIKEITKMAQLLAQHFRI